MICQTKRGKLKGWPHVPIKTIFIIFSGEHSVRARKTRLQVDKWLWLFFSFLVIMVGRERIPLGFSVILVNVVCFGPAPIRKWCGLTLVIPSPSLFTLLIPSNDHNFSVHFILFEENQEMQEWDMYFKASSLFPLSSHPPSVHLYWVVLYRGLIQFSEMVCICRRNAFLYFCQLDSPPSHPHIRWPVTRVSTGQHQARNETFRVRFILIVI